MDFTGIIGDLFDNPPPNKKEPTADQHLSSPIRQDMLTLIRDALILHPSDKYDPQLSTDKISYVSLPKVAITNKDQILLIFNNLDNILPKLSIDATHTYGVLFQLGCGTGTKQGSWFKERYMIIKDVLKEYLLGINPDLMSEFSSNWDQLTELEIHAYTAKIYWEDLKQEMIDMTFNRSNVWKLRHTTSARYPYILVNRSIGLLLEMNDIGLKQQTLDSNSLKKVHQYIKKIYMFNYEQVMMITDTITSRFFTLYFSRLLSPKFKFKCDPEILLSIYKVIDDEFEEHGNLLYNQIKLFESICHSTIIQKVDTVEVDNSYREFLQNEVSTNQYTCMTKIMKIINSVNPFQLVEIYGLYRLFGHPIVDEAAGCKKVQDVALNRPLPYMSTCELVTGCLIRQFCQSHIILHGRWPNIDVSNLPANSKLRIFIDKSITNINFDNAELLLTDWAKLKMRQEFSFDYAYDYTMLLSDKSISPLRSENLSTYDYRMIGIKDIPKRKTTKRVLTEVLALNEVNVETTCNKIMEREVPNDWLIVKLSPKEREINIKPRLFAMMVLDMRLYFCVTEQNISKKVFKYYPQQSMTSSEAKLAHRLHQVSSKSSDCFVEVMIGIDFKQWNLHWTYASTYHVFSMLDDLFGTPGLFVYTHEFFMKSEISLSSSFRIPDHLFPPESKRQIVDALYLWHNHCGGFEGLRQKGWTIITIGLLLYIESLTGIRSSIIGQGDNQVCKIYIKVPEANYISKDDMLKRNLNLVRGQVKLFMDTLTKKSSELSIVVKPLETWVSHRVLIYSKEYTIDGSFCSQALKRISRTMPDINELYPTLQNKIATIQTSGLTTAQKSFVLAIPFFVCQMESLLTLIRDVERLPKIASSNTLKMKLKKIGEWFNTRQGIRFTILLNTDFFGVPLAHLLDYYYRGHPDPLTSYTTTLDLLSRSDSELGILTQRLISWLYDKKYTLGNASPELLISNPTSTNIAHVDPVSRYFKNAVIQHIVDNCKNKEISDMFKASSREFDDNLYKYLLEFNPIFPRVLHEIAANTPTGTRLAFLSKFASTRTLQIITGASKSDNLSVAMKRSDMDLVCEIYQKYCQIASCVPKNVNICPTNLAQDIRDHSWRTVTNGRPIEGITIPHPLHLFTQIDDDYDDKLSTEYFSILSPTPITLDNLYKSGNSGMYVGNKTQEKKSGRILVIENYCGPLESAFRLHQIKQWCINPECPAYDYLGYLMTLRTNFSPDIIAVSGGEIEKGTFFHRFNDHMTKMSSLNNMRHTITTNFLFSSDNLKLISRGGEDYNIHVQGLILLSFRLKVIELIKNETVARYTKLALTNRCCIKEITNDKLSNDAKGPTVPSINTSNRLIYADQNLIKDIDQPVGAIIKMIDKSKPAKAMAAYLLSRLHKVATVQTWSGSDSNIPMTSAIGVTELMQTSILEICNELAYYLILYFEDMSHMTQSTVQSLPITFWGGIPENSLIPEVLTTIIKDIKVDGIPDLYQSATKIANRLNQIVSNRMGKFNSIFLGNGKLAHRSSPVFFLSEGINLYKIIRMWNFHNWLIGKYTYAELEFINSGMKIYASSNISNRTLSKIYLLISDKIGPKRVIELLQENSLKLMKRAPEMYFRQKMVMAKPKPLPALPINIPADTISAIVSSNYPRMLNFGTELGNMTESSRFDVREYFGYGLPPDNTLRKRLDHAYRQYDTVSTAHTKLSQIIYKEFIKLDGNCVCTADGESSMGFVLYKLSGNKPIYYNSLIDPTKLMTQRYENTVPGSFLTEREGVIGTKLSVAYGGDLTDDEYLSRFIRMLPLKVPLLTNDAEISGQFHPSVEHKMHIALLRIIHKCHPEALIKKCYLHNTHLLSIHISSYMLYFKNVKLVVPLYSSHEGKECYIVAINLRDMLPNAPPHFESSTLSVASNHLAVYDKLSEFAKKRNQDHPFQEEQYFATAHLMKLASLLHFQNNYTESVNRYLLMMNSNLSPLTIKDDLDSIMKYNEQLLKDIVEATAASYSANKLEHNKTLEISEYKKSHIELDRISVRRLNLMILKRTMFLSNQHEIFDIIADHLRTTITLRYNKTNIYKYKVENPTFWATEYLKHYWKIWGHINRPLHKLMLASK